MMQLTEEQRNDLAAECRRLIAEGEKPAAGYRTVAKGKVAEIALASLTAEPVYQFIANNHDKDGYVEWADCNPDYFSKEPSDRRRILYATPPAPELRLPDEMPVTRYTDANYFAGWHDHRAAVQRLNATAPQPVRLPPLISSWEGDDAISGRNRGIMDCAKALREQGFQVEGE